jgi:hypothetical protein
MAVARDIKPILIDRFAYQDMQSAAEVFLLAKWRGG